ncbi:MAG TPA: succinylglutamate desuccinylase/aspartoacylase family protein [Aggregatilinea sp.]|uniref:succinylglutamate desuccinylase/aspartoacylase family protein n=1 Tax=Aggregatilinea sp. TaxID=2806333 RepID=UPI002B755574|nr:succinylglutamate desuccinylase/aspartoacylase family protein [Aggregatilinea sp.]HML20438.1 succinylglutamate desuccinylase/aspartoacylase family protein [Aggregatilinea sp.]
MAAPIEIGTARSCPGQIVYGQFDAVPLPTGGVDALPVIIAQGHAEGAVLWLTASIHGNEYDGLLVIHELITPELVEQLTGTIVAIPTLNPSGLRTNERTPHYQHGKDPNRLFPGVSFDDGPRDLHLPTALELAYARLFARIDATADFLIDLHNYGSRSIPFVFRDPVFYRDARDYQAAVRLQRLVGNMITALGLTVINEYVSDQYMQMGLHRSVSGATLNTARIPAVTIELGGQNVVNPASIREVTAGIRNMMRWATMLPGPAESVAHTPVADLGGPVRRVQHPRVTEACIVHTLVEPGQRVSAGQPVARMVDIYGRPVGSGQGWLCSDYDGVVLGLYPGITYYPNEPVMGLAIRDDHDLIVRIASA